MIDTQQDTLRLGDRVIFRVTAVHERGDMTGDVIGVLSGVGGDDFEAIRATDRAALLIGWTDDSQSWESPKELRLA